MCESASQTNVDDDPIEVHGYTVIHHTGYSANLSRDGYMCECVKRMPRYRRRPTGNLVRVYFLRHERRFQAECICHECRKTFSVDLHTIEPRKDRDSGNQS